MSKSLLHYILTFLLKENAVIGMNLYHNVSHILCENSSTTAVVLQQERISHEVQFVMAYELHVSVRAISWRSKTFGMWAWPLLIDKLQ